jgi:hypothetical protein
MAIPIDLLLVAFLSSPALARARLPMRERPRRPKAALLHRAVESSGEARIPGRLKATRETMREQTRLEKPKNVWESLQDVNLHDLRPLGGSYILIVFLNI